MPRFFSGCVVVAAAFLGGCAHREGADARWRPATPESVQALANQDLALTQLTVKGQDMALPDQRPTLRFLEAGRIAGKGPVNRFMGGYELSGDGRVTWPAAGLAGTRMAGPPEAMELEQTFFNALTATSALQTSPGGVQFRSQDGRTRVEFSVPVPAR
jgi:heat shock protein HslJ